MLRGHNSYRLELNAINGQSNKRRAVSFMCLYFVVLNCVICALLQAKGSSDKRGWSFRKRSARHRVLSNTVISETPSSANKESPEDVNINYQQPANSTVLEKISVIQSIDEKPQLSTSVETKVIETVVPTENENKLDVNKEESVIIVENKLGVYAEESVIIVIQAAIRGFLVVSLS